MEWSYCHHLAVEQRIESKELPFYTQAQQLHDRSYYQGNQHLQLPVV
jgi:hypothetical protein